MAFDVKKLGLDRFATGMSRAGGRGNTRLTTGDITKGEVVTVGPSFAGNTASAPVSARRTGAIMISRVGDTDTFLHAWYIENGTLTVNQNNAVDTTYTFWVF